MSEEIEAMHANNTWSIVPLPADKTSIGCRWVYTNKMNSDGTLARHKARLVAKGYTQQQGVDFIETFSPVAKLISVKFLLAIASSQNWFLSQLDISNAFLNGDLFEEVYMDMPMGYIPKQNQSSSHGKLVCKLHKSIYGLKQASRQWNLKFTEAVVKIGFVQSKADYSMYTRGSNSSFVVLLLYVDDIVISGPNKSIISDIIKQLSSVFRLKNLGDLKYFLGLEVARSSKGIVFCQRHYALQILEDEGFLDSKPLKTPMDPKIHLTLTNGDLLDDATGFRRLIGRLLYLTITRPDITFAVNSLSQFVQSPHQPHLQVVH